MSTSNPSSPLVLPVITIDPTFPTVIQDVDSGIVPSETFWMSCYRASEPSVHANIQVELDEVDRNLIRLKPTEGDVEIVQTLNGTAVSSSLLFVCFTKNIYAIACYLYNRTILHPVNHCVSHLLDS